MDAPLAKLKRTIICTDISFMYNAFILREGPGERTAPSLVETPDLDAGRIEAIPVGAYDGEGFVVLTDPGRLGVFRRVDIEV